MSQDSYLFKIVLLGDGSVGKTSLRKNFMGAIFDHSYHVTIGPDFSIAETEIDGSFVTFQIWDLSGQPTFKIVRTSFYMGSHGALIVFDLTNESSFYNLGSWVNELFEHGTRSKIPLIILGNKNDLSPSILPNEAASIISSHSDWSYDTSFQVPFLTTSALTGENVDNAFKLIGKLCIQKYS